MRPTILIDAPEGDWGFSAPSDIDSDQSFFPIVGFVPEKEEEVKEEVVEEPSSWLCLKKLMAFIALFMPH
jgi:hypothetical protein